MAEVWKEAFPVGTEWDQYEKVYGIPWDFSHLEEAFEEGGKLYNEKTYLFGCTEPQLLHWKDKDTVIHVPAVVAVTSPFPPSEELGIKSVQMEKETIVPMRSMKMGWIPVETDLDGRLSVEKAAKRSHIFALKCTQRKAGLRQLKEERVKKYEYCLPYVYLPHMQEEEQVDTIVNILYTFEGETTPPLVAEFDWDMDEIDEFIDQLVQDEQLPESEKGKFKEYLTNEVKEAKKKIREEKEKRRKILSEMSEEKKEAYKNMKFFKFYPKKNDTSPDTTGVQSKYINRYYGKAHEICNGSEAAAQPAA